MAKNLGKVFETEFKESIPKEHFYYRLRDSSGAWGGGGENTRFTPSNISDCIVFNGTYLYFIELKNIIGTSLPFKNIKASQLKGLTGISNEKVKAFFIVCFRSKERCFSVEAMKVKNFIDADTRKSIPLDWFVENGLEITMVKKKVRYKYDLTELFKS